MELPSNTIPNHVIVPGDFLRKCFCCACGGRFAGRNGTRVHIKFGLLSGFADTRCASRLKRMMDPGMDLAKDKRNREFVEAVVRHTGIIHLRNQSYLWVSDTCCPRHCPFSQP